MAASLEFLSYAPLALMGLWLATIAVKAREPSGKPQLVAGQRAVGKLYLIMRVGTSAPALWVTEEDAESGELATSFGWYRHKKSRYAGSVTHHIAFLAKDVQFDPTLHKLFKPHKFAGARRVDRLQDHASRELAPEVYALYATIDRKYGQVVIAPMYVPIDKSDEFLAWTQRVDIQTVLAIKEMQLPAGETLKKDVAKQIFRTDRLFADVLLDPEDVRKPTRKKLAKAEGEARK